MPTGSLSNYFYCIDNEFYLRKFIRILMREGNKERARLIVHKVRAIFLVDVVIVVLGFFGLGSVYKLRLYRDDIWREICLSNTESPEAKFFVLYQLLEFKIYQEFSIMLCIWLVWSFNFCYCLPFLYSWFVTWMSFLRLPLLCDLHLPLFSSIFFTCVIIFWYLDFWKSEANADREISQSQNRYRKRDDRAWSEKDLL